MKRNAADLAEVAALVEKGALKPRMAQTMSLSKAGNAKELSQTGQNSRQSNLQGCIKFGFQKEADASSTWASQPTYFSEGNYGREVERGISIRR
jgi:hypothetical protein